MAPMDGFAAAAAAERAGRLADARAGYLAVLERQPGHAAAAHRLGLVAFRLGRPGESVQWLQKSLAIREDAEVLIDFGEVLRTLGQFEAAAAVHAAALKRSPDAPDAWFGRAVALHSLGRLEEAEAAYRGLLARRPDVAEAHDNLGACLLRLGRAADAVAAHREALRRNPGLAGAWNNLATALQATGHAAEAADACREAAMRRPDWVAPRHNLACLRLDAGHAADAVGIARRAAALAPDDAGLWRVLGHARRDSGDVDGAATACARALALDPADDDTALDLADLHRRARRLPESLDLLRHALRRRPEEPRGWRALARTQLDLVRPDAAAAALRNAVALEPRRADLLVDLATTAARARRMAESIAALDHALALEPGNAAALGQFVQQRLHVCSWDGLAGREAALLAAVRAGAGGVPPFVLHAIDSTPAEQRLAAERWAALRADGVAPVRRQPAVPAPAPTSADGRIRLGYLSGDLHEHAVAHLIAEVLERHDRGRFAVTAWSTGIDDGSAMRRRLMAAVERFEDIATLSDPAAARRIAGAGTDILVDLTGYTAFARTAILAARPAPLQVNWLGYPGTMGAPFIDAIIADPQVIPPEDEPHYSEAVIRLPHSYQPNDRKRAIAAETPPRAALGLPEDGFVFCCFNASYKIRPAVLDVWARLLHAVPGSVLWLYAAEPLVRTNLTREAARRGLAPQRLVFAPPLPSAQHLARHRAADLFLDTLPYNAHTTASDALWAGLPLVTCRGGTFAARVAASLLTAAGLPDLVTGDLAGYEALALDLARDPARLAELRQRLAARRDDCPLFDSARFTRDLEAAYTRMHENRRRGATLRFAAMPAG